MLQRIQSIFIGLSISVSLITFFIPSVYYTSITETIAYRSFPLDVYEKSTVWIYLLFFLNILYLFFSVLSLISFKKRMKQIKLCYLTTIFNLLLLIGFTLLPLNQDNDLTRQFNWPFGLMPLSFICLIFAIKYIKRDEELVRSADRIR